MNEERSLPLLAAEADLPDMLGISQQQIDRKKAQGFEPVGLYLPSGSRTPIPLYQVPDEFSRNRRVLRAQEVAK